jgi:transcriptional regulator with XRE-family HTH domain
MNTSGRGESPVTKLPELPPEPTLGDVVRYYRRQKGWNQSELVRKLDGALDQGQLSRLEGGTLKTPRLAVLRKLGEVLDVPPGKLLELSRFPGAPILTESLNKALVDLPQDKYLVIEHLVRFASDRLNPAELTPEARYALGDFLDECQRTLASETGDARLLMGETTVTEDPRVSLGVPANQLDVITCTSVNADGTLFPERLRAALDGLGTQRVLDIKYAVVVEGEALWQSAMIMAERP